MGVIKDTKGFKVMQKMFNKRWLPVVALIAWIGAQSLFISCQSPVSLGNQLPSKEVKLTSQGEREIMKTTQTNQLIEHVNAADFNQKVLQSDVPVLVDFYAEWCGPCKALAPVLEEVAQETPNAKIVKVDVDENSELAYRYRIDSIPSVLVFNNNEVTDRHVGLANKAVLKRLLTR
jgi:thioredoxin 1